MRKNNRRDTMNDKKKTPRVKKDEWLGKPIEEWNEQDHADYADYLNNRRPIRFFFGKGTTEEDIDTFLDNILED
ncbi:MAG TPA: hypothetical protein DCX03_09625 [Bacteroidales bacterium]|nr:hypothetical protein [Bacteroidales bacterium]